MASPNVNWGEIATTTLFKRSGSIQSNIINNNALLLRLQKRGNIKTFDGGDAIVEEISYAANDTYKRYSGYELLNIAPQDVLTAAQYQMKLVATAVSISGEEMLRNSGSSKMIDLLEARVDNAQESMQNNLSTDLYSDGTADGGKQIGGLQSMVSDTGLGTVGGISANTWAFWRNQIYDFSAETVTPSATAIRM